MRHIKSYLVRDHLVCDELLAAVGAQLRAKNWVAVGDGTGELLAALETHFVKEERVLFPFFDTGDRSAARAAEELRDEHRRMLAIVRELISAAGRHDAQAVQDGVQLLGRIMERHNANEESYMFTSGDELLGAHADRLIAQMERIAESRRGDSRGLRRAPDCDAG